MVCEYMGLEIWPDTERHVTDVYNGCAIVKSTCQRGPPFETPLALGMTWRCHRLLSLEASYDRKKE